MVKRVDGSMGYPRTPASLCLHVEDRIVCADPWWKVERRAWLLSRDKPVKCPRAVQFNDSLALYNFHTVWYAWGVQ